MDMMKFKRIGYQAFVTQMLNNLNFFIKNAEEYNGKQFGIICFFYSSFHIFLLKYMKLLKQTIQPFRLQA
ncbi:hypothetical protein GCM10008931_32100 [Oceanobacillus oncorhynchi subsp. oncorhynchi]